MILLLVFFLDFGAGKHCHGKYGDVGLNYTFTAIDYSKVCCKEKKCTDYRGTKSATKSGKTCQAWNSQKPHRHRNNPNRKAGFGLERNYCRNPDSSRWAWCYTITSTRWELCDIPKCSDLTLHDSCLATPGMLGVQRRLIQVSNQLSRVEEETKATESQIEEMDAKIDGINKKLKSAQKKCEESKTKITATRNQASQLKKDLDEAKNRLNEFYSTAAASEAELQKLVDKIKADKKHLDQIPDLPEIPDLPVGPIWNGFGMEI